MKYRFRYESLLKYRRFLRDEAELKLSKAIAQNRELKRKKKTMLATIDRTLEEARNLLKQGVSAERYRSITEYTERLKEQVKMLEKEIERSNLEVETRREKLVERMVAVKVLERLSRKDFENFKKEMKLKETRLNDELVTLRYNVP